ncbi:MAG: GxxExxY protein [Kofleriaceae bacterium]
MRALARTRAWVERARHDRWRARRVRAKATLPEQLRGPAPYQNLTRTPFHARGLAPNSNASRRGFSRRKDTVKFISFQTSNRANVHRIARNQLDRVDETRVLERIGDVLGATRSGSSAFASLDCSALASRSAAPASRPSSAAFVSRPDSSAFASRPSSAALASHPGSPALPSRLDSPAPEGSSRSPVRSADGIHAELSYAVNGAAIEVHRHIGPGQYESVYERALCNELRARGIACDNQVEVAAMYKGQCVGVYYADIVVERKLIVELKVVSRIANAHRMQVLTYLRASGLRLGLIMNFNAEVLWREIKRVVL